MKLRKYKIEKDWSKQFDIALNDYLDLLFALASHRKITLMELAKMSRTSYGAISSLADRRTQRPRFSTIWKIAKGLGVQINLKSPALAQLKKKAG